MKQNDFYEVNGCTEFIPVTINETFADGVGVTVHSTTHPFRMMVKQVYRFPKQHEPQKVVVPKFVAEWIEECKHSGWHLEKVLYRLDDDEKVGDWAYDENDDLISEKVDMIARAWLDGYEIEQEKLYTVEIPNNGGFIVLAYINHAIKLVDGNKHFPEKFTKESIEYAGFDWALKWAKPVEVE
ncbi:TPA: DUF1642 domain-containing protein [Streptococcus suis]|nr:DUF1642 domain-containing protein [Streptococcus suis]HEM5037215.1 DUF1642 domain-containing protein [Streptococcus suis]HEM5112556.1 DUF1642 domain-containing protein [Streptococcus suis]HEM5187103.1 DUF1642 domain-containing protein [Streptococcus suis]HEM5670875.1 DUF1642 domain-containing protein [Streptococcus suis]